MNQAERLIHNRGWAVPGLRSKSHNRADRARVKVTGLDISAEPADFLFIYHRERFKTCGAFFSS